MQNSVKERLITVMRKNGYDVIHRTTYGELKKKYPRFVAINNMVQKSIEGSASEDHETAIVTPVSLEYIHGINSAKTKMELELYFELMFHEARELAVIMAKDVNPSIPESKLEEAREIYSTVLDSSIRPMVSKILDQFI